MNFCKCGHSEMEHEDNFTHGHLKTIEHQSCNVGDCFCLEWEDNETI